MGSSMFVVIRGCDICIQFSIYLMYMKGDWISLTWVLQEAIHFKCWVIIYLRISVYHTTGFKCPNIYRMHLWKVTSSWEFAWTLIIHHTTVSEMYPDTCSKFLFTKFQISDKEDSGHVRLNITNRSFLVKKYIVINSTRINLHPHAYEQYPIKYHLHRPKMIDWNCKFYLTSLIIM